MAAQTPATPIQQIIVPSPAVLTLAAKIAIQQDRPIQLDYYVETAQGKAFLVEDTENKEHKVLLKSRDEYTSLVTKIHKAEEDYLILTENSLYIVSGKIGKKKVTLASLAQD
jgi:hypothetical protein